MALQVVLTVVLVLAAVERSAGVRCFSRFNQGQCAEELGEIDEDDCCQNSHYGYQDTAGQCKSCGPPAWSPWSSWSFCNILCGPGVSQRTRTCFGSSESECEDAEDKLQVQPCNGTCCDAKGWGLWQAWSSCTVSCGVGGVRNRRRICSGPPECAAACAGPSDETETCPPSTCPVHGGWSSWSDWSDCSGSCIAGLQETGSPSRTRRRSCSNPAPSSDTTPPGNRCPGDELQRQACSELPNCPVDGGWGAWSPVGKCSTSCGEGLQLYMRKCDQPTPRYGGQLCAGQSTKVTVCQATCPVDGFWSGWSSWGECSASCNPQGRPASRTRQRSCSNPAPSTSPPGQGCAGDPKQAQDCGHLPSCPVDGGWSAWTPFSSCPVTCGAGLQVSDRKCNSPAPNHGGRPCPGNRQRSKICQTKVHCPVDGVWSRWSEWSDCKSPFGQRDVRCKEQRGMQRRRRECLHQAHNGSICIGEQQSQTQACYNVNQCYCGWPPTSAGSQVKGSWEGWAPWSLCQPSCGEKSKRHRRRVCKPDYSNYNYGRAPVPPVFSGTPRADCGATPDGGPAIEIQKCFNAPSCS